MKLGLGTAQFGLDYGISNAGGKVAFAEAEAVLARAFECGVDLLDTAPKYGDSEQVIGRILHPRRMKIVTKTPQFDLPGITRIEVDRAVATFHESLAQLRTSSVYGLLVHQAEDLLAEGGEALYEVMLQLKAAQSVEKIGASVYSARQIDRILARFEIDVIQLPLNVLDQRLRDSGHLSALKRRGVEIHVRSAFLQGLLLMEPDRLPAYFDSLKPRLVRYRLSLAERRLSPLQGALGFLRSTAEIDYAILGVTSLRELDEALVAWDSIVPDAMDFAAFACQEERYLNPTLWKTFREDVPRLTSKEGAAC